MEDRWRNIEDREKESPESIDIRIHNPANLKILIEVTRSEEIAHSYIGVSLHRVSGVDKS